MEHCARNGSHKILEECSLPLTGVKCVDKIITEMGVLEITDDGMVLAEIWPEFTVDEVKVLNYKIIQELNIYHLKKAATGCELIISPLLRDMQQV